MVEPPPSVVAEPEPATVETAVLEVNSPLRSSSLVENVAEEEEDYGDEEDVIGDPKPQDSLHATASPPHRVIVLNGKKPVVVGQTTASKEKTPTEATQLASNNLEVKVSKGPKGLQTFFSFQGF